MEAEYESKQNYGSYLRKVRLKYGWMIPGLSGFRPEYLGTFLVRMEEGRLRYESTKKITGVLSHMVK